MNDVLKRLYVEHTDLVLKYHKLLKFLKQEDKKGIEPNEHKLMQVQAQIMLSYINVLKDRITLIEGKINEKITRGGTESEDDIHGRGAETEVSSEEEDDNGGDSRVTE